MTVSAVPFVLQNVASNAVLFRQAVSSLVQSGGGVVENGDLAVFQTGTPSMNLNVVPGRIWIPGNSVANVTGTDFNTQGMYFALNDANYPVSIGTSDSTNPRIDVVYIAVNDSAYVTSAPDNTVISVVQGVAAPTPTTPGIPVNAVQLATVNVAANVTSIINSNVTQSLPISSGIYSLPAGLLAYTSNPATSTGLYNSPTMADLVTVSLVKYRWYTATYRTDTIVPTAANVAVSVIINKSATSDSTYAGTSVNGAYTFWTAPVANSGLTTSVLFTWQATATETVNLKAVLTRASGTATYNISNRGLTVIDLGHRV